MKEANPTPNGVQPVLLTTEQAAAYLAVSKRTFEDWRYKGCGPRARKLGRLIRYHIDDLIAWLNARGSNNTGNLPLAA